MSNLIQLQKDHVLKVIDEIQTAHNIKFLVIDKFVENLFTNLFHDPNEILSHVTSVELIDSPRRKGQHTMDVVYLLKPTKFNINCIDADFTLIPTRYNRAHVRFLVEPGTQLAKYYLSRPHIANNRNFLSTQEVKLAFIPREQQFFQTLHIDKPLQIFYNKNCHDLINVNISRSVESLLNLCILTGEYPIVRYCKPNDDQINVSPACKLGEKLAFEFQRAIDSYARQNQDFPPTTNQRPRAVLIITDRSMDLFSLLLHDFSYQAMAYDLVDSIDIRTDMYHYKSENEMGEFEDKNSKLTDLTDPDWVELRHQHIIAANEFLTGRIKEMIAKNPLLVDRSKVKNTSDLLNVVAHLKDFDEDRRRLILHKTLIEQCLKINSERKLAELAEVEQNLAGFGIDFDGHKVKNITDTLLDILNCKDTNLTDKVRYIMVYTLYRGGIIEEDLMKLLSFGNITTEHENFNEFMTLFKNFNHLAFKFIKEKPHDTPFNKEWFHDSIIEDQNIFTTSRFVPAIGNILSKVITNPLLLTEENFPFVKDKPIEFLDDEARELAHASATTQNSTSLRKTRHRAAWTKSSNTTANNEPRQRIIYYSIGGITYPELRAAYEQSNLKNKDIFIGSDGILTPCAFMKSIEYITAPREFLRLQDDQKENENIPNFMVNDLKPVAKPVSHVHRQSHNARPINGTNPPSTQIKTSRPQSTTSNPQTKSSSSKSGMSSSSSKSGEKKEKKHSKFSKFLRSKD